MSPTPSRTGAYQLSTDEVHCWCVRLDVSPGACARLNATLTIEELARSARLRYERDRRRFVVAHGVLRELLARYLRTRPGRIRYEYNTFGKPDLTPLSANPLKFNLSHSADLALIAIAAESNVGVDLEYIRAQPDEMEIAERFFSADDVRYLKGLPNHLRTRGFFSRWTRTEAYVKACGGALVNLDGASKKVAPDKSWSIYTLRPAPGYVGALAIQGSGRRLVQRHWQKSIDTDPSEEISPQSPLGYSFMEAGTTS